METLGKRSTASWDRGLGVNFFLREVFIFIVWFAGAIKKNRVKMRDKLRSLYNLMIQDPSIQHVFGTSCK